MVEENMAEHNVDKLIEMVKQLRCDVINMVYESGSGHPGGALSAAEIVAALYFDEMNLRVEEPKWPKRDRFILSKGHCCPILYAALCRRGFFDESVLHDLRKLHSPLQGHPDMRKHPALDMTSGSLGNGLSLGLGMALATRASEDDYFVYVLMGDGEQQEGAIWEAAMAAAHYKVNNLIGFVDVNHLQLTGNTDEIISLVPLEEKWKSFGWDVYSIDGNDIEQVLDAIDSAKKTSAPSVIIADTIKGKGVSFMENEVVWHSKVPNNEERKQALLEICGEK